MRCYPRLGCPIVDEIAAIVSAPELANTPASSSKQAARATPTGLLRLLCAGDAENVNQPGFYVEPTFYIEPPFSRVFKI